MHFLYKLVIVTSLIFGTFDVHSADLMNLEELINRIKTSIKPPIIEIEIKSTYQSLISEQDMDVENLYQRACEGNEAAYQELTVKAKAKRNDPIAQGFFARFLHSMGNAYFFVEILNPKVELSYKPAEDYVKDCADALHELAEAGHPYALEILGYLYTVGCGVIQKDLTEAGNFTRRAAHLGLLRAQNLMGYIEKTRSNEATAIAWFLCAMRNDYAVAFYNMTLPFRSFSPPEELTIALLERATQGNYQWARYTLGQRHQNKAKEYANKYLRSWQAADKRQSEEHYRQAFHHFHDLTQSHYIAGYFGIRALSSAQALSYQEAMQLYQHWGQLSSCVKFGYTQREKDFSLINALTALLHQFTLSQIEKDTVKSEEISGYIHHLLELQQVENLEQTLQSMLTLNNGMFAAHEATEILLKTDLPEDSRKIVETTPALQREINSLEHQITTFLFASGDIKQGVERAMAFFERGMNDSTILQYAMDYEKEYEQMGFHLPTVTQYIRRITENSHSAYNDMQDYCAFGHYLGRHGFPRDPPTALMHFRRSALATKDSFIESIIPLLESSDHNIHQLLFHILSYFYDDCYCALLKPACSDSLRSLSSALPPIERVANFQAAAHQLTEALSVRTPTRQTLYTSNPEQWGKFTDAAKSLLTALQVFPIEVQRRIAFELGFLHLWRYCSTSEIEVVTNIMAAENFFSRAVQLRGISLEKNKSDLFLSLTHLHLETRSLRDLSLFVPRIRGDIFSLYMSLESERNPEEYTRQLQALYKKEKFTPAALKLATIYYFGIRGINNNLHKAFYWSERAREHDNRARTLFKARYPLSEGLSKETEDKLWKLRTIAEEKPKIIVWGGGITGILTALNLSLLKDGNGNPLFDIDLIEANPNLMDGASKLICRLHLGNEYPTDFETAIQCLFGATLFRQQFQTNHVLTSIPYNDFLIARDTIESGKLTPQDLENHNKLLRECYRSYLKQVSVLNSDPESLLFGPSSEFYKILSEELIPEHFGFGIRTKERGLQPIALGVVLEDLLKKQPNIHVHRATPVKFARKVEGRGFELTTASGQSFYSRYLVNATWHNISLFNHMLTRRGDFPPDFKSEKKVYIRSMAIVDTSACILPLDNSYFGLLGKDGGMFSRFNQRVASIFIPDDDFSYQGDCVINDKMTSVSAIPSELQRRLRTLAEPTANLKLAKKILDNAKTKYPQLNQAKPLFTITRTTLTQDESVSRRTHLPVKWDDGYIEAASAKGTFAPFTALQVAAEFVKNTDEGKREPLPNSESKAREFLHNFLKDGMFDDALLPQGFVLVSRGDPIECLTSNPMYRYAFYRHLPFAMFEDDNEFTPEAQFSKIEWEQEIDLEHHIISAAMVEPLVDALRKGPETVKLGPISSEIDEIDRQDLEERILQNLTKPVSLLFKGRWNLNIKSLRRIIPTLEDFIINGSRFTRSLFPSIPNSLRLQKLSCVHSYLDESDFGELIRVIPNLQHLQTLDLSSNNLSRLENVELLVEDLITALPKAVRKLSMRDNGLFEAIIVNPDAKYDVLKNPKIRGILKEIEIKQTTLTEVDLRQNGPASAPIQDALDAFLKFMI